MNTLITIVVPVYNTKQTLKRTIDSILNQTYKNLEIIIIDDGSNDETKAYCDELTLLDERLAVIHKQNEGLGLTRNVGINSAKGDYIIFIDSDDYIELDMVEQMLRVATSSVDIVCSDLFYNLEPKNTALESRTYAGNEVKDYLLPHIFGKKNFAIDDTYNVSACTKMYSLNFLRENGLVFKSERKFIWEDLAFNCECLLKANQVLVINQAFYHYCYNKDSLTHMYDPKKFDRTMLMYDYLEKFIRENNVNLDARHRLAFMILGNIRMLIKQVVQTNNEGFSTIINNLDKICKDQRISQIINDVDICDFSRTQRLFNSALKSKNPYFVFVLAYLQNKKSRGIIN